MKLGEKAHWHIFPISIYNEAQHSCIGSNRSTSSPFFLQNMQNQDSSLVLSADAKPRLKWTSELHQRFVDAVNQLGGPDKATPKGLKRVMGIPGLTLYHLKSHLQKYRLGKHQPAETCSGSNQEDCKDNPGELDLFREGTGNPVLSPMKESLQIAQAIQIQMEVQRKLHEQIEVQRHLQLRIEAQGKYLQTVLRKAEETLSGHASSSTGVEQAKAELSQLVSMVSSGCMSSSLSELTEMRALSLEDLDRQVQTKGQRGSLESSLTSSEDSGSRARDPLVALPLLDPARPWLGGSHDRAVGQKRGEEGCHGRETKRLHTYKETLDLNSQCQVDQDLGQAPIDLNSSLMYL